MEKKEEHMLKFYLIFNFIFLFNFLYGQNNLDNRVAKVVFDTSNVNSEKEIYPGKPLIMSLVIPGAGQYYNKAPLWKTSLFFGIELVSLLAWNNFNKRADTQKEEYQKLADEHWSINTWVENRFNPTSIQYNSMNWTNFSALNKLTGTHHLSLIITGSLANELNLNKVSSDSLEIHPDWISSGEIQVVRDRHFYENIGKYDQFLGGWSDAQLSWFWEEKDVGDSTEIIIKTPLKENYINQRYESNQMLNMAKYSITVLMFNHVFSGIESVWYNQRKAKQKKEINTNLSLFYNMYFIFYI